MNTLPYTGVERSLHWFSAVIIIWIIWALDSGFYVSLFEVSMALKGLLTFINISLTTVLIPFFVVRVSLAARRHVLVARTARLPVERLASFVHGLIYLVMSIVLVTGVLMMDQVINVFDLVFIPQPLEDPYWISLFFRMHVFACIVLAVLVALHISAVVKHEISGRRVLANMWFKR